MIFGFQMIPFGLRAFGRKLKRIVTGMPLIRTPLEQDQIIAICQRCPNLRGSQCGVCLCFVETKAVFRDEYCPDKPPRWW